MASMSPPSVTIHLHEDVDVVRARQAAIALGMECGFDVQARARLDLVVAELASNVVYHAGRGRITMFVRHDDRPAVWIDCTDSGPTARNRPSHRSAGLGLGLGAARELADGLTLQPGVDGGTRVEAVVRG
jgi:serine/threonine-protein kinase RsbT